ncbi:uncharacterized protein LOC105191354 isoform X2 [Harpegnathos saltator]|uniref:F-box domain-containing protein n=1 Tax=Harpegnathos saltator TaxID=610380 RepID=E2C9C7_HARSA|nr:uncharacterized protein LOC105191354 isoform X2 [Harpegnathos saltator]EFN75472.1 hypothetical protein EAI_06909 [Harpegnathos saltator]
MNKGCWKFDEEDKALYIDLEEEDAEEGKTYSSWDQTPDILLEEIFSYLTIRERYYASLVCRAWYRAFKLRNVWSTFTLEDTTLTRGKFNYYSGWQYVLDHMRTSTCLNKVGRNFRTLIFEPMLNFYNLYEFMNMISWYAERQGSDNTSVAGVGTYIRRLKFTFPCNMANRDFPDRIRLFGTGGKLLEALKRLMRNLQNLRCLELIDLMLDNKEALHLMDDICTNCTQTLSKLVLINTTRYNCPLLHVGVFVNLNVLVISPQNLHEDIIELIGYTKLQHLHILQNRYSAKDTTIRLPKRSSWVKMRAHNPHLKVHFEVESHNSTDILLPIDLLEHSAIPCHSIILDNSKIQISPSTILTHGAFFDSTIRVYAFKGITKYYMNRSFATRLDEALVQFCKMCPQLHTLMIRDKISTATILEIVSTAKRLRCLYVRRNVVLKRCDRNLSRILDWSPEHHEWVKVNSRSYENTEREVSKILRYRWHMLSEREFKDQAINMHI